MSSKSKQSESFTAKNTSPKKKSKAQSSLAQTFGNNAFLLSSLRKTHNGAGESYFIMALFLIERKHTFSSIL
jgi:hypothetical protein